MAPSTAGPGAPPTGTGTPPPKSRLLSIIGSIGPPIAVASSVLAYFGWAQAKAEAAYMGLDVALFGYAAEDYVRFSVTRLFGPLIFLFVVGIGWLTLDGRLSRRLEEGRGRPAALRIATAVAAVALSVAGVALLLVALRPEQSQYAPYVVAAGVLLAAWAQRIRRLARAAQGKARSFEQRAGETTLVLGLVTLLLFWGAGYHAQTLGRRAAMDTEQHVDELPRVSLYSPRPLAIGAPTVTEANVGTEAGPLYRYDGLRLLEVSGGRLFFVPTGWTARTGTVVVLSDNDTIRIEYGN